MSIEKEKDFTLQKLTIGSILDSPSLPLLDTIKYLLSLKGYSISDIAKKASVSRQAIYDVINDQYDSKKVKQAITKALGFNPWAT